MPPLMGAQHFRDNYFRVAAQVENTMDVLGATLPPHIHEIGKGGVQRVRQFPRMTVADGKYQKIVCQRSGSTSLFFNK